MVFLPYGVFESILAYCDDRLEKKQQLLHNELQLTIKDLKEDLEENEYELLGELIDNGIDEGELGISTYYDEITSLGTNHIDWTRGAFRNLANVTYNRERYNLYFR